MANMSSKCGPDSFLKRDYQRPRPTLALTDISALQIPCDDAHLAEPQALS